MVPLSLGKIQAQVPCTHVKTDCGSMYPYTESWGEAETGPGADLLASLAQVVSIWFRDPVSKNKAEGSRRGRHPILTSDLYTHPHINTYKHAHPQSTTYKLTSAGWEHISTRLY